MMSINTTVKEFAKQRLGLAAVRVQTVKAMNTTGRHYCPICESNVRSFLSSGHPPRPNVQCPVCRSLSRHRLAWAFLAEQTNLLDESPKMMLHVAPEVSLTNRFKKIKNLEYLSADLDGSKAMVAMDLTDIHYPDNHFSAIYCSHVLEHIIDDQRALSELYRVLKVDGWAFLQVPMSPGKTYEDFSITDPQEREKHFGQWDHVRLCGSDYIERISAAGFVVEECLLNLFQGVDQRRMELKGDQLSFCCRRLSSQETFEYRAETSGCLASSAGLAP
ncbi:MAG: methyltransferase domain-containing protein [Cyanobacteria bacterium P01_A01_bin.17]